MEETLLVKIRGDSSELRKAAESASKALKAVSAAAVAGAVAIGKASIESYAEYEQLVGGMDTLFGESSSKIQEYAANAYKTAGISANEYMSTATAFSASLLQSLGNDTEEAAKITDMAIQDMSDNANKMGVSMESIQNAYKGFAKQNYTMLDNLQLGYGGTKSEMERLLADAQKLSGVEYDISNLADVYNAIHVIQGSIGMTGTTAKEAESTITGSLNAMKASQQNMLTGMADENADFVKLTEELVSSIEKFAENLIPRIKQVLLGMGSLITTLLPQFLNMTLELLAENLPSLIVIVTDTISTLINSVVAAFPVIVNVLAENSPMIIDSVLDGLMSVIDSLIDNLPAILSSVLYLIQQVAVALIDYLPVIIDKLPEIINGIIAFIVDSIPLFINLGVKLFVAIVENLPAIIMGIIAAIPEIVAGITKGFMDLIKDFNNIGRNLFGGIWEGLTKGWESMKDGVKDLGGKIVDGFKSVFGIHSPSKVFAGIGGYMMEGLADGIDANGKYAVRALEGVEQDLNANLDNSIGYNINSTQGDFYNDNSTLISAFAQFTKQIITAIENNDMEVNLDGKTIAKSVSKANKDFKAQTGYSLI